MMLRSSSQKAVSRSSLLFPALRCRFKIFRNGFHHRPRIDTTSRRTGGLGGGVLRPVGHQPRALVEQVAAPIRSFDFVANGMGQRHFDDVVGVIGALGGPIAEGAAEAVHRDVPVVSMRARRAIMPCCDSPAPWCARQ